MPIPENVENLRRVSAKSSIYQVVCSWIITGVLKPGEKIVDSELAKRFNVSRTPVREAIQILEGQKLVYVVPGRATVVADIDPADIEKCYRTLAELQGLAAELACGSLTDRELEQLSGFTPPLWMPAAVMTAPMRSRRTASSMTRLSVGHTTSMWRNFPTP